MTTTATTIDEQVEQYMALPYRIELIPDPEGWFVRIPDLRGCMSQGDTVSEAMEMIHDAQRAWLTVALEDGVAIPPPHPLTDEDYSGKFNVRVPKQVHRALAEAAAAEGVSLNLFVASALAAAVGQRHPPRGTAHQ